MQKSTAYALTFESNGPLVIPFMRRVKTEMPPTKQNTLSTLSRCSEPSSVLLYNRASRDSDRAIPTLPLNPP